MCMFNTEIPGQQNKVGRGSRSKALIGRRMKRHSVIQEVYYIHVCMHFVCIIKYILPGSAMIISQGIKSATLPDG